MVKSRFMNIHRHKSHITAQMGKNMRLLFLVATLVIIPVFAIGCTGNSNNTAQPDLYFPVQKEPQTIVLNALSSGKLVADNGYLRVRGDLIIWPYGYSWKAEKNEIWIINDKGQAVARVGDDVRVGGGEIPASFVEEKIGQKLPDGIEGPFWLAGEISVINQ